MRDGISPVVDVEDLVASLLERDNGSVTVVTAEDHHVFTRIVGEIRLEPLGARIDEHCSCGGACMSLNKRTHTLNHAFKLV